MGKGKWFVIAAALTGLFYPVSTCLASEPGTVIQLSMGMVILGGAIFFSGGSLGLKKMLKKKRQKGNCVDGRRKK